MLCMFQPWLQSVTASECLLWFDVTRNCACISHYQAPDTHVHLQLSSRSEVEGLAVIPFAQVSLSVACMAPMVISTATPYQTLYSHGLLRPQPEARAKPV
jgi:hypothetical protein